jgi:ribosomal protein L13E
MSDHDAPFDPMTPDPMDRAYAQAEAVLSDEAARGARRARVLAAVAGEAEAPAVQPAPQVRRADAWGRGGWLVAAGVAGLGVFLASQVYLPTLSPRSVAPPAAPAPAPAPADRGSVAAPTRARPAPATPRSAAPPTPKAAPQAVAMARRAAKAEPSPAAQEIAEAAAPAPAAAARAAADSGISEIVVTAEKRRAPVLSSPNSPAGRGARLREAAAAGLTAEVARMLARSVPVDAADAEGETALMKAVQADAPAVAALLRRHGASLDRKNHAGASVRDMAASIGDAELNQALGLGP